MKECYNSIYTNNINKWDLMSLIMEFNKDSHSELIGNDNLRRDKVEQ